MVKIPLSRRPLAFLDTETTGLDPTTHEVIEIAIIREDPGGLVDTWSTKIKPRDIGAADEYALKVNGYTEEAWADAPTMAEVAPRILNLLRDSVIVGHNVSFDEAFINSSLKRAGVDRRIPYHKVDTVTLAYEHLVPYGLTSLSLDNIRKFLGWSLDGAHTALKDTEDARQLFKLLVNARRRDRIRWWLKDKFGQE
jgi:DNA polymerase-3 subunit epsilon